MRAVLFHEFHHLVRGRTQPYFTLMDKVVAEGLATAFERDFAHAPVPFGEYPPNAAAWLRELQAVRRGDSSAALVRLRTEQVIALAGDDIR